MSHGINLLKYLFRFWEDQVTFTYLKVLIFLKILKKQKLHNITNRIRGKLQSWIGKLLSMIGVWVVKAPLSGVYPSRMSSSWFKGDSLGEVIPRGNGWLVIYMLLIREFTRRDQSLVNPKIWSKVDQQVPLKNPDAMHTHISCYLANPPTISTSALNYSLTNPLMDMQLPY